MCVCALLFFGRVFCFIVKLELDETRKKIALKCLFWRLLRRCRRCSITATAIGCCRCRFWLGGCWRRLELRFEITIWQLIRDKLRGRYAALVQLGLAPQCNFLRFNLYF